MRVAWHIIRSSEAPSPKQTMMISSAGAEKTPSALRAERTVTKPVTSSSTTAVKSCGRWDTHGANESANERERTTTIVASIPNLSSSYGSDEPLRAAGASAEV